MAVLVLLLAAGANAAQPNILVGADLFEYAGGSPPMCYGPQILADYGKPAVRRLGG